MPYTNQVFGISTEVKDYSYVDRANLDNRMKRLLRRDTHIAIKGPSKCGKSWLRQKCVENAIIVQCRLGMTVEEIYKYALCEIGVEFDFGTTSSKTFNVRGTAKSDLNIPFLVKGGVQGEIGLDYDKMTNSEIDFASSTSNLSFIANAIKKSGKRLIVEDFHYLSLNERQKLAHDLKSLWDYQCYIIIIGIWTQTNLLTFMNPDLTGRIEEISILWTNEELKNVIEIGSSVLNISIDYNIVDSLINDSFGNVGILQALLLKLVEDQANIEETSQIRIFITDPQYYVNAAQQYASQLDGLYQQFAKKLSAGIRKRNKSTGIYAYAIQDIVEASDDKLKAGYSRDLIFDSIHAKENRIQKGNLKTVLRKLVELQGVDGKNLVISYDESIDAIFVVDLQLLFYRKHHTMKWPWEELVEEAQQLSLFEEDIE